MFISSQSLEDFEAFLFWCTARKRLVHSRSEEPVIRSQLRYIVRDALSCCEMGARICSVLERRSGFGMSSCALLWIGTHEAGSKRGLIVREDEVTAGA